MAAAATALLAALCFALSTVAQHRAAADAPAATGLGVGLLWRLGHSPLWLLGVLSGAAAAALQALALSFGALVVVQPLLVTGMLFAIPASVVLDRRRVDLRQWGWAVLVVVGVAVFLLSAHPARGRDLADPAPLVWALLASAAGLGIAVALGLTVARRHRAALLGFASGIAFGVTGALLKQVVGQLAAAPRQLLSSWPPYALLLGGLAGVVLAQVAYQAGALSASQPALTIAEPLVAVLIGWFAFGEQLATGPAARLGQLLGFALLSGSVLRLALLTATTPSPSLASTTLPHPLEKP